VNDRFSELDRLRARAQAGGGHERVEKQHRLGKLTARERLDLLFDTGTFIESGLWARQQRRELAGKDLPADGVVTGQGRIYGRPATAYSQDFTVGGGAVGVLHASKIVDCLRTALKAGCPIIGFNDGGGARIQEGVDSLSGYGRIFFHNTLLSGVVPQISVIAGPCAGGATYSPALTDFVVQVEGTAHMFITGPEVIRTATGEEITEERLGGASAHASIAGTVHLVAKDDREAVELVKTLLTYLPANNRESPPDLPFTDPIVDDAELDAFMPEDQRRTYDVKNIVAHLVDAASFFEIHSDFARNIVVGFARLSGMVVGIVANQPAVQAGTLDIKAATKAARFVRTCDVFNVPIITLVDVPGFLPGVAQEHGGIIRHGAQLLYAYSEASVPKLTVILRRAYGGAFLAMCSKDLGADTVLAWPTAEIAVMGPEGAARVLHRRDSDKADDPKAFLQQKIDEYRKHHANPFRSAEALHVDDIIRPSATRRLLAERLSMLRHKSELRPERKHGNLPL
jgi:acetyl-CoA carboxylase carboxyltransferase component